MFNIYHIPTFIHKDGSIGKIGCTTRPKKRVEEQGYSSYEILETHDCIDSASLREIELQKEYGYPIDKVPYWKVYKQRQQTRSLESCSKGGKIGGKVTGLKAQKEGIGFFSYNKTLTKEELYQQRTKGSYKRWKPILQYDIHNSFIKEWKSIKDARNTLKINGIHFSLSNKRKAAGGFIWKYKD